MARLRKHGAEDERRGSDDEDDVDELASHGRAAALDAHRHLEAGAQRRHHPGRRPAEDEEADEAEAPSPATPASRSRRVTSAPPRLDSGSASTISLITSLRSSSFRSTIPKIATSTIESGTSEKRTR